MSIMRASAGVALVIDDILFRLLSSAQGNRNINILHMHEIANSYRALLLNSYAHMLNFYFTENTNSTALVKYSLFYV